MTNKLEDYLKLAEGATDGPWRMTRFDKDVNDHADCGIVSDNGCSICRSPRFKTKEQYYEDFPFIAASRTLGPALARALIEAEEALKGMIEYYDPGIPREPDHIISTSKKALATIQKIKGGKHE